MGQLIILCILIGIYRMKMQCSQPLEIVHPTLQMTVSHTELLANFMALSHKNLGNVHL